MHNNPAVRLVPGQDAPMEPVSVAEMILWAKIEDLEASEQVTYVFQWLITAARQFLERVYGVAIVQQQYDAYWEYFPCADRLRIPKPPLVSIQWLKTKDSADVETVVDPAGYFANTIAKPGELVLRSGARWPSGVTLAPANGVTVRFTCGWSPEVLPLELKQATAMMVLHWYTNPEAVAIALKSAVDGKEIPLGVSALMENFRSWLI